MSESIPLPSHVHYELLLQLLEQQTLFAAYPEPHLKTEVNELIITLRKALSQQRKLEEDCDRIGIAIDYRWSLNRLSEPNAETS
ncbi:MAG: DUF5340 domain-containing protein [Leptolyngbya sp. SIO1D8]|nr:DUF5340 domain-containing protein [Leptolyngbya sp. SIO1D8]